MTDLELDAADQIEHEEELGGPPTESTRVAWAEAARPVLIRTARRYRAMVSYKDLAAQMQEATGISTRQPMQHWMADVLHRVAADCAVRDEPNLGSLAVNAQGSVGAAYASTVLATRGETIGDSDDHAARERLACHEFFDAPDLPADGGVPTLTEKLSAARTRARKASALARPVDTCPTCNMALPATKVCDNCA
jgi:hypothetical protein